MSGPVAGIKVLEIGEIKKLFAKGKEFSKGAGIKIPHIQPQICFIKRRDIIFIQTCHMTNIASKFLKMVKETLTIIQN